MYLLGVLCLVSLTAALPFSEPRAEDVATNDPALHTDDSAFSEPHVEDVPPNDPALHTDDSAFSEPHVEDVPPNDPAPDTDEAALEIDAQKGEQEEKNDEDRTSPIKPPHREVIIELHKVDRYSEREDPDKIIPKDLGVGALLGSVANALGNAIMYGLPSLIGIVQRIPLLGPILARNSPARVLVYDD